MSFGEELEAAQAVMMGWVKGTRVVITIVAGGEVMREVMRSGSVAVDVYSVYEFCWRNEGVKYGGGEWIESRRTMTCF